MFSFESDKMSAKLLLFIRHSQIVHQVQQLVKEVFGLDAWFTKLLFCKKMTP